MKYLNIFLSVLLLAVFASCSKENPFPDDNGKGKVNTRSLAVELVNEENIMKTRAGVDVADFTVQFFLKGETAPKASFRYGDMPEVVELPVGTYYAKAFFGANASAAWDAPYYEGYTLSDFDVKADQVTMVSDPIVCKLSNVKVTVIFADELASVMSADSKVSVKVGEHGSTLDFTKADADRSGYFAFVEGSTTLAAIFTGEVEGHQTTETKVYDDVRPGNHYRIVFTLHSPSDEEPGDISVQLRVDASVEIEDVNRPVDSEDDVLVDDLRPKEDGDDPEPPAQQGPVVEGVAPINLEGENVVNAESSVKINVKSSAPGGITEFRVKIISNSLSPDELSILGLAQELDLVNPGDKLGALQGLHFIPEDETTLGGKKDIAFDISEFMMALSLFGNETHRFQFTVSDANGTTEKTLVLKMTVQ